MITIVEKKRYTRYCSPIIIVRLNIKSLYNIEEEEVMRSVLFYKVR